MKNEAINPEIVLMVPNLAQSNFVKQEYVPTKSDKFNIWLNNLNTRQFNRLMKHVESISESESV